jgi:LemA protein
MQKEILWGLLGFAAVFIFIYNRIIALVQARKNAFSDVDVQLKQRYDLVPNLIETVKGYAAHEKGVLENLTAARTSAMKSSDISERLKAERALGGAMMSLLAVAENYPQLKADGNFKKLQEELADVENKIAAARRFFNTAIRQFPAMLIAFPFGYREEAFFEVDAAEKALVENPVKVNFGG